MTDLEVIWAGRSAVELARRMEALADLLEDRYSAGASYAAHRIREVLNCDENPLPDQLPELGDPPRLRPMVPGRGRFRLPRDIADPEPRRAKEPGE